MGGSFYSFENRVSNSILRGYNKVTADNISDFGQNKEKKAHESMLLVNAKNKREARDSEVHANTFPIQVYLDVTGSMLTIPAMFIKEGLPKLVSGLMEHASLKSPALLFSCIGDHTSDNYPLQVGQFESGDEELDLWLERSYVEGNGGGNEGESYLLAWFNAGNFVVTDAWEKRKQKGFVFTIGDEPTLLNISGSAIKELYGENIPEVSDNYAVKDLLSKAQETNYVFHIHVNHTGNRVTNMKSLLGQNCIEIKNYEEIPELIYKTINSILTTGSLEVNEDKKSKEEGEVPFKVTL